MKISKLVLGLVFSAMAMFATVGVSSAADTMRLCTGAPKGNYDYVGQVTQTQLRSQVDVTLVPTAGAWENLQKLAKGECDAAIVQSDSLYLYGKEAGALKYYNVSEMYTEYFHLICGRNSGVEEFADLSGKVVKVFGGGAGSGSETTLRGLIAADKEFGGSDYVDVAVLNADPTAGLVKVKAGAAACQAYTGSKGNNLMAVNAEKLSSDLILVPVEDKDFNDVTMKDANDNEVSVWTPVTMPSDTYGKIMPSGTLWGNDDLNTIGVTAMMIVGQDYADAHSDAFTALGLNINDIVNAVRADKGVELVK